MPRILTVRQTAERLNVTENVVRRHLRTGKLRGHKLGRLWQVLESDVDSYMSAARSGRSKPFVSARGLLKSYPGRLSSADVIASKREEAEIEEAKLSADR